MQDSEETSTEKSQPVDAGPPPSYASIVENSFHSEKEAISSEDFSGQHSSLGSSGHINPQAAPVSNHEQDVCQSSGAGNAFPHNTYCTIQAAPVPVQGGYQYSPSQGMVPVQGAASYQTAPFAYSSNPSRRRYAIIFMLVFCVLVFFLTLIFVIIFVALRPAPHL